MRPNNNQLSLRLTSRVTNDGIKEYCVIPNSMSLMFHSDFHKWCIGMFRDQVVFEKFSGTMIPSCVIFKNKEDAILCILTWDGTMVRCD